MDSRTIEHVARLAALELDGDSIERMAEQLTAILEHFRRLDELDTEGVEPAVSAVDVEGTTRPDEPRACTDRAALLSNTVHVRDGFIVVPRVIE